MQISKYCDHQQREVIDLIVDIQTNEFGIKISADQQPDLKDIAHFYQQGRGNFWVSTDQGRVVGTISLLDIGNENVALRKMFVHADYRGKEHAISSSLLSHALKYAKFQDVKRIYLGTTEKFIAAHKFYEKNGFTQVSKLNLPPAFPVMAVDTKFYLYTF